jgi:hypothetical protein
MNPVFFIVGCPRSGTTLLQRIVNAHPQIAVPHETHWIPKFYKQGIGLTPEGRVTPQLVSRVLGHRTFAKLGVAAEDLKGLLTTGGPVSYADFVSGVFNLVAASQGKPLAGDKTPEYGRNICTLHSLWPRARFVHLIRDGRDVCQSMLNWKVKAAKLNRRLATWGQDPATTAGVWWKWNVRLAQEAGQELGAELYHELRYEALVTRPEEECARLCAFLEVPYEKSMLRFHEGRTRDKAKLDAKRAWRPITPGLRVWRTQMPAAAVERFEAAAGDLLDQLGYPRGVPEPGAGPIRQAAHIRALFIEDVRAGEAVLPDRW